MNLWLSVWKHTRPEPPAAVPVCAPVRGAYVQGLGDEPWTAEQLARFLKATSPEYRAAMCAQWARE